MVIDPVSLTRLSYGLYVITSRDGDRLNGQIGNVVFQVTSQPCRLAIALNTKNLTHELVAASGVFGVSVLSQETDMPFVGLFGFRSGRDVNKMARVSVREGETGCPLVMDHALACLEARVSSRLDVGSHTIFVGDVVAADVIGAGQPMTYDYYHAVLKGKTSENAPTFRGAAASPDASSLNARSLGIMKKYVCTVCGYVYDPSAGDPDNGVAPGTPFESLPDGWVCPICGAKKDQFEPE